MKVILHIGAGKCGSSALQRFLSVNPILPLKNGGRMIYAVVGKEGEVMAGNKVRQLTELAISGYINSAPLGFITRQKFKLKLPMAKRDDIVVLSSEGWRKEFDRVQTQDALSGFGQVEAIMYVRPQIHYFNSAYWQWGAWEDKPLNGWISARLPEARWVDSAKAWAADKRVKKLTLRTLPSDIVTDFLEQIGVDTSQVEFDQEQKQLNRSLPDSLLRTLQRHRHLRPGPHDSEIDFVLERYFGQVDGRPAWVLNQELCRFIIDYMRNSNVELLSMLKPDQAKLMQEDKRWWEPPADDKVAASAEMIPAADPEADKITAIAIEQVLKLERRRLHLKSKVLGQT